MPIDPKYLHLVHPGEVFTCCLYGRSSRDPKKRGRSVGDQLHDGRVLADTHGWLVIDEFKDTGVSATRYAHRARDDFEEMLSLVQDRRVRIVVAYEASRYYRDLEVYVRLRNACAEAGVLLCYNGQIYDLTDATDRKLTAQDALQAEVEGDAIRERNLRTVRLNATAGRPHGRTLDGYRRRYDPDTGHLVDQVEDEKRGPVIRRLFDEAESHRSIRGIVTRCGDDGLLTQHGTPITRSYVLAVLRNPAYMGRRVHQGREIGDATWPALITPAQFQAVQDYLDQGGRTWARGQGSEPRHLLSGIAVCGLHPELAEAGEEPVMTPYVNGKSWSYRCSKRTHVSINEDMLHAAVEEAIVQRLERPEFAAAFQVQPDKGAAAAARARLAGLERQLTEAQAMAGEFDEHGEPQLSVASLVALERRLTPLIAAARADVAPPRGVPDVVLRLISADDVAEAWEGLELEQQRSAIRHMVTVRVHRAAGQGARRLTPERVTYSWYGEPGFRGVVPRARGRAAGPRGGQ
ncbi:recombinase family protein [Streptomyces sp. NPDC056387]|uniref:recombinase family protein n=1 Tax=Streptomyces sp. NPDC056387 TaxID=3345803 RepID=UPI0035DE92C4